MLNMTHSMYFTDLDCDFHSLTTYVTPSLGAALRSPSFFDWISTAMLATPAPQRLGLATVAALTTWSLWRHRNVVIFDKIAPSSSSLVAAIKMRLSPGPRPKTKD